MAISSVAHIDMSAVKPKPERVRVTPALVRPKVSVADLFLDLPLKFAEEEGHAPIEALHGADDVPWDRTAHEIALDGIRGGLRRFQAEQLPGADKRSQVLTLIEFCLGRGVNTGKEIVDMVGSLGFDRKHVGMMLASQTGSTIGCHRWCKGIDGTYQALTSKAA